MRRETLQALVYSALVLALGLALLPLPPGSRQVFLYSWTPTVAVVLTGLPFIRQGGARAAWGGLGFGKLRAGAGAWLTCLALPFAVLGAGYALVGLLGVSPLAYPAGVPPARFWVTMVLLIPAAALESVGEEIGWRGYLLPRLVPLGRVRAWLWSGLLWGCWHWPLIFTGAYHAGGSLPLTLLLFTATILAFTLVINEVRVVTGSLWLAALLHGAHNAIWFQLRALPTGASPWIDRLAGESGVVPLVLYGMAALVVLARPAWKAAADA